MFGLYFYYGYCYYFFWGLCICLGVFESFLFCYDLSIIFCLVFCFVSVRVLESVVFVIGFGELLLDFLFMF